MRTSRFWTLLLLLGLIDISLSASVSGGRSSSSGSIPDEETRSDDGKEDVVILTSVNFEKNVGDGSIWLVEFYATWCHHCQQFAPAYTEIAEYFQTHPKYNVRVGKVDTTVQRALGQRFDVRAYPSFFIIHGSSVYEFEGSRSKSNLIEFATDGHKEQAAVPFLSSPMGPIGKLQGLLIWAGMAILGMFNWVQNVSGLSPLLAGCLLCGIAVASGMVSMFCIVIALTPKEKAE